MPHLPFFVALWFSNILTPILTEPILFSKILIVMALSIWQIYSTLRIHIFPYRKNQSHNVVAEILYGGQYLTHYVILAFVLQLLYYIVFYCTTNYRDFNIGFLVFDGIYTLIFVLLFLIKWNTKNSFHLQTTRNHKTAYFMFFYGFR